MTEAGVLDFTSASYLGLRHPRRTLRPWPRLTTGVPAALAEPCSIKLPAVMKHLDVLGDAGLITRSKHWRTVTPSRMHPSW